ncbi:type II secretion system F family protein [Arthrobacter sp. RCC_34]|uniref:type II secretion system F family protein n=1 Tax=Arthrobacter sp. RCC_34 TaxID=3239230 RepID=UPI0035244174
MLFVVFLMVALLMVGPGHGAWVWRHERGLAPASVGHGVLGSWSSALARFRKRIRTSTHGARNTAASDRESMAVLVQHLGALLNGGRSAAQAWRELLEFQREASEMRHELRPGADISVDSSLLAVAAQAAELGESPAIAIHRQVVAGRFPKESRLSVRQWSRLAACVRAGELSGCPLADLLERFALDLEHSADAERSRQTALAGPRASVALLGWLPFFGLGLGLLLGVDPVDIVLRSPLGGLSVVAGLLFWFLGRVWSSRLVRQAEVGSR